MIPKISVVVVSDYDFGKTWDCEQQILLALSKQDISHPFEIILVENSDQSASIPAKIREIANLKIVFTDLTDSSSMKDFGVQQAVGELIAVIEADCIPNQQWLRLLYEFLNGSFYHVVSGRTVYGNDSTWKRVLTVMDRSFDVKPEAGATEHISNNGALYRRKLLEAFPYPKTATPFLSSRERLDRIRQTPCAFGFEPRAIMTHAIGGLEFLNDFRRNTGYADMMCHPTQNYTQIPKLMLERFRREVRDCLREGPRYLRWYDWPLLIFLQILVPFLTVPGMIDALRKVKKIPGSAYH
jgi:hypothetical protein